MTISRGIRQELRSGESIVAARAVAQDRAGLLVLAVDPANVCGWAAWRGGKILESGSVAAVERQGGAKGVDVLGCYRVFQSVRTRFCPFADGKFDPGVLVVEEQHPMPPRQRKADEPVDEEADARVRGMQQRGMEGLLRQTEARQTWECWALLYGWQIVRVVPATWTYATLSRTRTMKRAELKERSILRAKSFGVRNPTEDEADAINIGSWWAAGGNPPTKHGAAKKPVPRRK